MVTKEAAIKQVQSLAREIKKSGLKLRKVILFGSYAKGEQREYSDIDVALIADEFSGLGFEDLRGLEFCARHFRPRRIGRRRANAPPHRGIK